MESDSGLRQTGFMQPEWAAQKGLAKRALKLPASELVLLVVSRQVAMRMAGGAHGCAQEGAREASGRSQGGRRAGVSDLTGG